MNRTHLINTRIDRLADHSCTVSRLLTALCPNVTVCISLALLHTRSKVVVVVKVSFTRISNYKWTELTLSTNGLTDLQAMAVQWVDFWQHFALMLLHCPYNLINITWSSILCYSFLSLIVNYKWVKLTLSTHGLTDLQTMAVQFIDFWQHFAPTWQSASPLHSCTHDWKKWLVSLGHMPGRGMMGAGVKKQIRF